MTEAEPIYAAKGEFRESWPLLSLGGPIPVEFTLHYAPDLWLRSPMTDGTFPFPPGFEIWAFTASSVVKVVEFEDWGQEGHPACANVFLGDDLIVLKEVSPGVFSAVESEPYELRRVGDTYFFLDPVRERVLVFGSRYLGWDMTHLGYFLRTCGEVEWTFDRNGNFLRYTYDGNRNPTRVEDGMGRALDFGYLGGYEPYLASVSDGRGRSVQFHYGSMLCSGSTVTVLDGFTDAAGNRSSFEYYDPANVTACALVGRIVRPLGNCTVDQEWDFDRVVTAQRDAIGNETTVAHGWWGADPTEATFTFADGTERSFVHRGGRYPLEYTDEAGHAASFRRDASDRLTGITDTLGRTTTLGRAACGKVSAVTDPLGNTTVFTHEPREQTFVRPGSREEATFTFWDLTRVEDPEGTWVSFARDGRGNILSRTHSSGDAWSFAYDPLGNATSVSNPAGGTLSMTYNPDGSLASRTDPETGTTRYHHDAWGRPSGLTHPDGTRVETERDAAGRVVTVCDEALGVTSLVYDANGNPTSMRDPAGAVILFTYDAMDRLTGVTDRAGGVTTRSYNAFGNPVSATDPSGIALTYAYDPRGWYAEEARGGAALSAWRDDEGRPTALTEPGGAATTLAYDAAGRIARVEDPLGRATTLTFDAAGAVTSVTDAAGETTSVEYDGRHLPRKVTHPGGLSATVSRGAGGLVTEVEDSSGSAYGFEHSAMGRLSLKRDPLGRVTRYAYDDRGRMATTTFPDGEAVTRTYAPTGQLMRRSYGGGPDLGFAYDANGRMTAANGAEFRYDGEGRLTSARYGEAELTASYDGAGRLVGLGYPGGMAVTYAYDATTGLLTRISDSLSGAWVEIAYGADRRPAAWSRSNGVAGSREWDAAGQLSRVREGDFLDLTYAHDAAGRVLSASGTWPLEPASTLAAEDAAWTYDAASQVVGDGCSSDGRGRQTASPGHTFVWDGASRLVGCDGASLEYDGLDALSARTDGGTRSAWFPHPAIQGSPPVAEAAPGGEETDFVFLPTGELLYSVRYASGKRPTSVSFYHFDRGCHTVALTDATGAVTDRYAYDPYGKLLAHEGGSVQPFTFQGRWGTRQEGATGEIFQVGARTYHAGMGRFLTPDPAGIDPLDPRTLNPYAFAYQDPVTLGDATGLSPWRAAALRDLGISSPAVDRLEELERELVALEGEYDLVTNEASRTFDDLDEQRKDGDLPVLLALVAALGPPASPEEKQAILEMKAAQEARHRGALKDAGPRLSELRREAARLTDAIGIKQVAIQCQIEEIGKTLRCVLKQGEATRMNAEMALENLGANAVLDLREALKAKDYEGAERLARDYQESVIPLQRKAREAARRLYEMKRALEVH